MEISKRQLQDEELTAYHGSPHSFDKFSTQHMGTGEGAQAFGWGLYFTELEDIADRYAKIKQNVEQIADYLYDRTYTIKDVESIEKMSNAELKEKIIQRYENSIKEINTDFVENSKFKTHLIDTQSNLKNRYLDYISKSTPTKYRVTLHKGKTPEQYNWLVWDKPLTDNQKKLIIDQSRKENLKPIKKVSFGLEDTKITPESVITSFSPKSLGMEIYRNISAYFNSDKEASLFLLRAGIDGIKYPAESIARGTTSDTARGFNYVVFDENAVNIEKQTQFEGMEISKRQLQENLNNIIYTAVFFDTNEIVSKYPQVHPNLYSHHSTIQFKPTDISNLPIGEEVNIKVIGRLTNDKVDALIVSNPLSINNFPHITLSTAQDIKPFQSNVEIENNQDKIKPINDNLIGTVGYFDGKNEVTEKQTQFEGMEITKGELEEAKKARTKLRKKKKGDRCTRIAKSKYDVWPSAYACVPESSSKALTRDGWKTVDELNIGEEILTYNINTDKLEFKPILNLHRYKDAKTNVVRSGNNGFVFEATDNHKWVVKLPETKGKRAEKYERINDKALIETKELLLNKHNKHLVVTAPYDGGQKIKKDKIYKYGDNWVKYILDISDEQRQTWLFSAIVYDGNQQKIERLTENKEEINDLDWKYTSTNDKQSFGFKQKDVEHRDAFLLSAFLNNGLVTWKKHKTKNIYSCHYTSNKRFKNTSNFKLVKENNTDVWCPETENGTWVMMQETEGSGIITTTGNSGAVVKCRQGKIWRGLKEEEDDLLDEKWSEKYKKSIDCNNPKGFSQKAHCKGRLKEEEEYGMSGVEQLEKKLLDKYKGLKTLFLTNNKGVLSVDMIEVNPNERSKGIGSNVINDIIEYADANNMEIRLNPALKDERKGTTSRNRLVRFYKSFGFIENTGRNIDYTKKSGSMYRLPKSVQQLKEEEGGVDEKMGSRKQKQLDIINKTNPAPNNYNTWIRSVEDILSPEEAFKDDDNFIGTPDFRIKDAKEALKNGEIIVYSSYPIKNGVFVTPSKMEATLYAGYKTPYSKKVKLTDVAWINSLEGQYAKVNTAEQLKEEEENNIDKRKIYVLVGPPSVGKSTWIKDTFSDIQPYIISRDDIVEQVADELGWTYDDLFVVPPQGSKLGDYDKKYGKVIKSPRLSFSKVLEANNKVQVLLTNRGSNAVNSGKDIVVDMTNMTAGARKNALRAIQGSENLFEKIAVVFPFEGAEEVIIDVARKRAEAAERMGKSKTLPDSVMRNMFASFQKVTPEEGFDKVIQQDNRELLSTLNEEDKYLLEPKRPKPKTTLELGISTEEGKGVDNIIAVYNDADDEEKDYWGKWYYHANKDVTTLSNNYGIDFRIAAAVVAVLSPGNKWLGNLYAAEKTIQKFNDPSLNISISAYGKNVIKALKILETGDVAYVKGPKVSVFFLSLVDPQSVNKELVLDSHAINIWFGIKRNLKQTPTISNKLRNQVLEDYKKAAQKLGVSLQSLQAVTWYVWKYTKKPPVVKHTNIKVKESSELQSTLNEKTDFSKEKEQGLHGWFARQGGKGKSKGWVDCNTCRDGKCKSCGRKEGESRSKYPACRPTPSACKTRGKGKSWGKKSTNEDALFEQSKQDIERELKLNEIKNTFKRLLK
jgi:GNAT superfamily N-acetyltransferase/predicted kinase